MSWIRKAIFLLIGLGGASLVGVVVLELAFGSWFKEDKWKEADSLNIIRGSRITYPAESIYGKEAPTVTYSRDEFGLRGSCKNPSDIDILTIGGSTTDQRFIGDGQTYQDILQAIIREKLGHDYCVSNAGVDGHSTFGHLASFQKWFPLIPDLKPTFVMLYVGINDAGFRDTPNAGFDSYQRPNESRVRAVLREKSALYGLLRTVRDVAIGLMKSNAYAEHSKRPPSSSDYMAKMESADTNSLVQSNSAAFAQRFSALLVEIGKRNATPICVSQPHRFVVRKNGELRGTLNAFEYDGTLFNGIDYNSSINALNEAMRRLCTQADGFYIDIASKNFEVDDFYDVVHMTPRGARKLAEYLLEAFQQQGILARLK